MLQHPMVTFWTSLFYCLLLAAADTGREYSGEEARQQEADRVKNLPGQPPVKFRHYAGYVKLRPQEEKALFYWFFEAQEAPSQKPLVLWLNGVANIIFLESPVGVGFSYTNNSKDLHELGDRVSASDNYAFLIGWFKRFPSFRSHEFYIAGESYAGHYVPQLADVIYEGNKATQQGSYINFKGFMIGNAVINDLTDVNGLIDYAWSHAIISDKVYNGIAKNCDFEKENQTKACAVHVGALLGAYKDIDIYNIYSPICLDDSKRRVSTKLVVAPHLLTQHDLWHTLPSGYDPCTEDYVSKYFNNQDVQKALHANITKLPYPYTPCSSVIQKWNDSADTVLPIIQKLLNAGLRIWIYSGDTDGRVPVTSTRYSINKMGLKVKKEWRAWFHKHQVAGWVEVYEGGLTFATIRGAGHQVPVFAPQQSLSLFTHFLSSHSLPSSRF
ncbi:serine carboxypeptidase-like 35 isoform X2 [Lotus japonicus]|uniref:serine carboxypeptidase-like 35 isoform X2 n=1 Tax=Lotus japonicus TaxID=34305 RepID=UPI00258C16D9|nr:serine carboxypeptidase-like 35 isoform X2 [Lotus japonicus]